MSGPLRLRFTASAPALALAIALALAACSVGGGPPLATGPPPPPDNPGPAQTYVAIGASETVGAGARDPVRDAWTQVFFRTALPRASTFVNLGLPGATVAQGLRDELPLAIAVHPTIVTVWLNLNDLIAGVSPADFERDLSRLVHALRATGAKVLVANTPVVDTLVPVAEAAPLDVIHAAVDAYNAATARVVAAEGALLVDLHAAGQPAPELIANDHFHPSTAGHAAVAARFVAAYRG